MEINPITAIAELDKHLKWVSDGNAVKFTSKTSFGSLMINRHQPPNSICQMKSDLSEGANIIFPEDNKDVGYWLYLAAKELSEYSKVAKNL